MRPQLVRDACLFSAAVFVTAVVLGFCFRQAETETPKVVLVDHSDMSTARLLKLSLTEPVCEELLVRSDVQTKTLVAALRRLSRLRNQPAFDTFFDLVHELTDGCARPVLRNLSLLSIHVMETELDQKNAFRARLLETAKSGRNSSIRKVAFASLVSVDGATDRVFKETETDQWPQLIAALPLVDPICVSENLYDRLRKSIVDDGAYHGPEGCKAAAIAAAVEMPHVHHEAAADLVRLLREQKQDEPALAGLAKLPVDALPEDQLGFVAAQFIDRLADLSGDMTAVEKKPLANRCLEIGQRLPPQKRDRLKKRVAELTVGVR